MAQGSYLIIFDSDQTLMLKKAFTQSESISILSYSGLSPFGGGSKKSVFEFSLRFLPAPRKRIKVYGIECEDSGSICFPCHDMFEVHLSLNGHIILARFSASYINK